MPTAIYRCSLCNKTTFEKHYSKWRFMRGKIKREIEGKCACQSKSGTPKAAPFIFAKWSDSDFKLQLRRAELRTKKWRKAHNI